MNEGPKRILIAASEAVPFCKSGGLGDVCGALPKALRAEGFDARLILPRYWRIERGEKYGLRKMISPMGVRMGSSTVWCEVWGTEVDGVPVYFVEHERFFGRAGLYDDGYRAYDDNAARFAFFSRACLQFCMDSGFRPDIIHAHDWQTALIPAYLKIREFRNPFFQETASVFTIHNIAHQGTFPEGVYPSLDLGEENFTESKFENYRGVNFMKGAVFYADAVTTVSPTYAREILEGPGSNGLAPYLQRRRDDLYGILNGADTSDWDPASDPLIPACFSARDLRGKAVCKKALQQEFYLEDRPEVALIGVITRFAGQKGHQLLVPVIHSILKDMVVQFVFLGSGEKWLEDFFGGLPAVFPGRVGAWIGHDNRKAHWIEAGSDFFLMPSLFEPCGLNQIYSMRYGTLPIVRETGGLKDTVVQYDEGSGRGTGFCFKAADPMALYYSIGWAISTYYDRPHHMGAMREQAMSADFPWSDAVQKYGLVYEKALWRRAQWS